MPPDSAVDVASLSASIVAKSRAFSSMNRVFLQDDVRRVRRVRGNKYPNKSGAHAPEGKRVERRMAAMRVAGEVTVALYEKWTLEAVTTGSLDRCRPQGARAGRRFERRTRSGGL